MPIHRGLRRRTSKQPKIYCPTCGNVVDPPRTRADGFSPDGCLGGHCACGAVYVVDETGRSGGQAVLDVLALLCDGDLDAALALESGVDYDMKPLPYVRHARMLARNWRVSPNSQKKIWFGSLRKREE